MLVDQSLLVFDFIAPIGMLATKYFTHRLMAVKNTKAHAAKLQHSQPLSLVYFEMSVVGSLEPLCKRRL